MGDISKIIDEIIKFLKKNFKQSAVSIVQYELKEMEAFFGLLTLGEAGGIVCTPTTISLALLPYIEKEIIAFLATTKASDDALAQLFSIFEVG